MPDIRITKLTHACVRVSIGGVVLLIDPSTWSEPEEFVGADACLITHEHADHVDPDLSTELVRRNLNVAHEDEYILQLDQQR